MRSLVVKLTLAFLAVAMAVVVVFATLLGTQTQGEFSRFLSARDQDVFVSTLANYYAQTGSWRAVSSRINSDSQLAYYGRGVTVIDAGGRVVLGSAPYSMGDQLPERELDESVAIRVGERVVGYAHFASTEEPRGRRGSNEAAFVDGVVRAALISVAIAAAMALLIGIVLARTLTKPVRALTAATKLMAAGKLGQQVDVQSRDELGELAHSFNLMSHDLEQASQSRKQMTADLAHDLRTPLTILRGYTEGLREGRLNGSLALYDIMHNEVEHLRRLVEDLRILSLADAGEMQMNKRVVDPKALLERTALAYMVQAEQKSVILRVDAPDDLPSISVDTDRMTQVLNNLVSNALRHTRTGEVVLAAQAHAQQVVLRVRDTGSGIAPADLPFVFERFYRADRSRQRTGTSDDSTGLGLAIAKAIVESHGGTISVESDLGHGTTFTIIFGLP